MLGYCSSGQPGQSSHSVEEEADNEYIQETISYEQGLRRKEMCAGGSFGKVSLRRRHVSRDLEVRRKFLEKSREGSHSDLHDSLRSESM